jgi:uncharacterized membrane protein YfcA
LGTTRRGTATWAALAALLIASILIGGVVAFALEDFFPALGSGVSLPTTIIIIVLFVLFVILRQRRVREIESEDGRPQAPTLTFCRRAEIVMMINQLIL